MATLFIREYSRLPQMAGGQPQIPAEPATDKQNFTISGASAQSAAFGRSTNYIVVTADATFAYEVGKNPTAATDDFRVVAGAIIFFGVQPGDKIAAITRA